MNLKNPDLFRSWLVHQLGPICKANPDAVSKYVCALLKKEKNDSQLKQNLTSQLDIFLDSATEEFVNFLIDVLAHDKYLQDNVNFCSTSSTKSLTEPYSDDVNSKRDPLSSSNNNDEPDIIISVKGTTEKRKSPSPIQAPTPSPPRKVPAQRAFSPRLRRNRFRNERRRVPPSSSRRSRRDSSHSDSPPNLSERGNVSSRQMTRKRSASGSSGSSSKSPRRSWIASRGPSDAKKYKHRHFGPVTAQRSRSPSPKLRRRKPDTNFRKRPLPASRPNSDDERGNIVKRLGAFLNELPAHELPPGVELDPSPVGKKQRCVDFEGKGYCARGDMCPFDHGPAPIVLDNSLLNGIVPLPPPPPAPMHPPPFAVESNMYTPQYVNSNFPPIGKPPAPTRELISVPTVQIPPIPKSVLSGKPSYGHVFSSLPPGISQTTIELTNVPAELNNIPDLYENYSSFGNITLIQAKRNGDAGIALLTFTNATEAALAFINTDSTIPNAKAAWYADKCIMKLYPRKSIPASGSGQTNAKSYVLNRSKTSANAQLPAEPPPPLPPTVKKQQTETVTDSPSLQGVADAKEESTLAPNSKEQRQDPERLLAELIKKKRELLEKQLASRKEILDKMKLLDTGSKEEKTWQEMLKKLDNVIVENENSIRVSLVQRKEYLQKMNILPMDSAALNRLNQEQKMTSTMTTQQVLESTIRDAASAKMDKSDDESDLDLSDHGENDCVFELDSGNPSLNREIDEDIDEFERAESMTVKRVDSTPHKDDSSSGTTTSSPSPSVEYTRVVVSGFENGDEDELLQHFSQFGQITDKEFDNTIPSATLIYNNRKSAEDARKEGRNFQDRLLSVTVYGGKKHQSLSRCNASFKPQYDKEYVPYSPYGGNPYKYKNPQIVQTMAPVQRLSSNRSNTHTIYSLRSEPKNRAASLSLPSKSTTEDGNNSKLDDEEEFISMLEKNEIDNVNLEKLVK